jgi:5-formyltetrahydrofolate cyclo-ligase
MSISLTARPDLRARMRDRRRTMTPRQSTLASLAITGRLLRLPAFRRARSVAAYWPIDGEVDVREALLTAHASGATTLLPVLDRRRQGVMRFAPWRPGWPLLRNRYGIPEPATASRRFESPLAIDLVIAPLVAFDQHGHRLGLGGGYYDRAFSSLALHRRPWSRLVGVAYEYQRVDDLEIASWDVTLSDVVTERRHYRCR